LTDAERRQWIDEYSANGGASAFEVQVVNLINDIRAQHGLSRVSIDMPLMMAARFYTQIKGELNVSSGHNFGPYGGSAGVAREFGCRLRWSGGNSGSGYRTPEAVVLGWMDSPGHRALIMSPEHRFIGVGYYPEGRNGNSWYMFLSDQQSGN